MRVAVPSKGNELTVLSLEILASCRGKLLPDPKYDRLLAVALAVWYDHEDVQDMAYESRILACRPKQQASDLQVKKHHEDISFVGSFPDAQLEWCESEVDMLEGVVKAVQALDPDMIVAFDLMRGSVGYMEERAQALDAPLFLRRLGRCPDQPGTFDNKVNLAVVIKQVFGGTKNALFLVGSHRFACVPLLPAV
jgi:DNA polymerase elongation subunit (family B)